MTGKKKVQEYYYEGPKALSDRLNKMVKEHGPVETKILATVGMYVLAVVVRLEGEDAIS